MDELRHKALVGAADTDGDVVWFVSPRELHWMRKTGEEATRGGGETAQHEPSARDDAAAPD
jgi:hypothetical protein